MSNNKTITLKLGNLNFILTAVFIALKVTHTIDWAWLWVLAPMWAPFAIFFGLLAVVFVGGLISVLLSSGRR